MGKDKFMVRVDSETEAFALISNHSMFDSIVGVVTDVCNMLITFVELRPETQEESCLLHERELNGVPLTVLRVVAKTEKEFVKVILDALIRSHNKVSGLIQRFDKDGFLVLELNDKGKQIERRITKKKDKPVIPKRVIQITEQAKSEIGDLIEEIANSEDYKDEIDVTLSIAPPWTYDESAVKDISAVSKNKRYAFRQDFAEMCDIVFGRKAIDRKLAVFAGITLGTGLYLAKEE